MIDELGREGRIDWSRASKDFSSIPATRRGDPTGPNPTDRARSGTKRHLIADCHVCLITEANRSDRVVFVPVIDAYPAARTPTGQRRNRPSTGQADTAFDLPRPRRSCIVGTSEFGLPIVESTHVTGCEAIDGLGNGPLQGCPISGASRFNPSGRRTSIRQSWPSLASFSALSTSSGGVMRSRTSNQID